MRRGGGRAELLSNSFSAKAMPRRYRPAIRHWRTTLCAARMKAFQHASAFRGMTALAFSPPRQAEGARRASPSRPFGRLPAYADYMPPSSLMMSRHYLHGHASATISPTEAQHYDDTGRDCAGLDRRYDIEPFFSPLDADKTSFRRRECRRRAEVF